MLYEADLLRIADALLLLGPLECLLVAVQLEGRESRPKFIIPVGIPTKSFSRYYSFRDLLIVMILGFSKREIAWMMKIHEISPREIFFALNMISWKPYRSLPATPPPLMAAMLAAATGDIPPDEVKL